MLNQSFSYENIREIYETERRKGFDIDKRFFPDIEEMNQQLKKLRKEKDLSEEKKHSYIELLNCKESLLRKTLEDLCANDELSSYMIHLEEKVCPKGKKLFVTSKNNVIDFFYMKLIQRNIKTCYNVIQSDRFTVAKQLKCILNDSVPKTILRIDIRKFYESISNERILVFLNREPILSANTRRIISGLFRQYRKATSSDIGLPRGLGISAYLAELYMRKFDQQISTEKNVIFYSRYVDDIVVVFLGKICEDEALELINGLITELGLEIHKVGEKYFFAHHDNIDKSFDYLGYNLKLETNGITVGLSTKKINKIKNRIVLAFRAYQDNVQMNSSSHSASHDLEVNEKLFIDRVRYLTGNTKLYNSKRNALIGIFFSNVLVDNCTGLEECDKFLTEILKKAPKNLQTKLQKFSFERGFKNKKFTRYSTQRLETIVRIWKYDA